MGVERTELRGKGGGMTVPACALAECPGKRVLLEVGILRYRCRAGECKTLLKCVDGERCMHNLLEDAA